MAVEVRYSGDEVIIETPHYTVDAVEPSYSVDVVTGILVSGVSYDGPYEVTPSLQAQVLDTYHKTMAGNLTINPIPSNYGLISWDGAVLTVS